MKTSGGNCLAFAASLFGAAALADVPSRRARAQRQSCEKADDGLHNQSGEIGERRARPESRISMSSASGAAGAPLSTSGTAAILRIAVALCIVFAQTAIPKRSQAQAPNWD
jgi:hypothetical protein